MIPITEISSAIKSKRESLGISQQKLADAAGVHVNTVGFIERGMMPKLSTLMAIARVLNLEVELTIMDAA